MSFVDRGEIKEIEIFCDEIICVKNNTTSDKWTYLGALYVPTCYRKKLLSELKRNRCIGNYDWTDHERKCMKKCGYHSSNNTEIHYTETYKNHSKFEISRRWIKKVLLQKNQENNPPIFFSILGINISKISFEEFGDNPDLNIYNRFFRSNLLWGIKSFFNIPTHVKGVYHDNGSQESHPFFKWQPIEYISTNNPKITFDEKTIKFINSDHKKYPPSTENWDNAHFIQFIDLIIGLTYCCLLNPTIKKQKIELALKLKPLLYRMMNNPKNTNSSFNYFKRHSIGFFPKYSKEEMFTHQTQKMLFPGGVYKGKIYTTEEILLTDVRNHNLFSF